ncbi:MAG TPA: type 4a pilus biogenesis protein PilO [Thermoanaerobaculia bacterium]|nr:type 4a pilus biogenesis protein PilO [Thermoanaerobaculia bacterium]
MALTLNDKPWYWGLGIGVLLAAGILYGANAYFVQPVKDKIAAADSQIAELDKKIEQGRAAERKLPQFREEVRRLELELEKLRRILPSTRNTEEIIKKIKSLVDQGDFGLKKLTFPKLAEAKAGDPYAEWPITVSVDGRYHDLAILFNRLSNFSRIMNVENISITALPVQTSKTITSDFIAKTFVYVEPTTPAKAAPGAKPGGPKPGGGKTDTSAAGGP